MDSTLPPRPLTPQTGLCPEQTICVSQHISNETLAEWSQIWFLCDVLCFMFYE